MRNGFIALHRSIREHWVWGNAYHHQWWTDILMTANFKAAKICIEGRLITIERGMFHTSEVKLAQRWGIDRGTVRRFLQLLIDDGMLEVKKTRLLGTTIKVLNYNLYQGEITSHTTTETTTVATTETTSEATTVAHKVIRSNKENKDNNDNKENKRFAPSRTEIEEYISSENLSVDAEAFFNFYESNGWMVGKNRMKDWQATVRTWNSRSKTQNTREKPRVKSKYADYETTEVDYAEWERIANEHTMRSVPD